MIPYIHTTSLLVAVNVEWGRKEAVSSVVSQPTSKFRVREGVEDGVVDLEINIIMLGPGLD